MTATTAFAVGVMSFEMGEQDEAILLSFVEALVKRRNRIGEFLECSTALRHGVSAKIEPLDRIFRLIGAGARRKALGTLLAKIAQRAFHGRPIFFLLSGQFEPGVNRRNARVTERGDVFRAHAPMRPSFGTRSPLGATRALLGVNK